MRQRHRINVARLRRAIADHDDICSRMAIPECAGRIASEYDRLTGTDDGLVLVRRDSGGVFPDGTTNTPPIEWSPFGHGTPVPEEAELPSGDARIEAL